MARIGSFIRFFIGLALSIEVLRDVIMGIPLSEIAIVLSAAFIALSIAFLVFRF
jgi:hypothetical protein